MRRLAWLTALLSGCWLSNAEITNKWEDPDTEPDTDPQGITTEIRSIEPTFGTDAGGVRVAIEVDSVGPDPEVRFGAAVATIVSIQDGVIEVDTPRGTEGPVDVTVSSGGGSATAEDGFWLWEDGQGEYGTVGALFWTDYVGDLARLGYVDAGTAWFQLVRPTEDGYDAIYGTGLDRCTITDLEPDHEPYDLQAMDVQLQGSGAGTFSLPYDPEGDWYVSELGQSAFVSGVEYRLLPPDGDAPWPAFGIDPIATTPGAFTVSAPDFEVVRLDGSRGQGVTRSFTLAWSTQQTGDYLTVTLVRWGPAGTFDPDPVALEQARCLLEDDGSFTVPSNLFSGWSAFYPIDLYIGRTLETGTQLPHNRADNGVVGQYRVAGTVWQEGI
jgi:hypothetical protein